jgi:hypothetical protein
VEDMVFPAAGNMRQGRLPKLLMSGVAVAATVTGTVVLAAGPASAAPLTCGSTITSSVKLTQDVDCTNQPTVNALTIAAPGVTVNLNGYQILGPGTGGNSSGIISSYSDLTVENGMISNFIQDVQVSGPSGLVLQNLAITNTANGIVGVHAINVSNARIQNLFVDNIRRGIWLDHCRDSSVSRSDLVNPGLIGLWDQGGSHNAWSSNTVQGAGADASGILAQGTTDAVIEFNAVNGGPGAYGVQNVEATGSMITSNRLNGLKIAVVDQSSSDSTVFFNFGFRDTVGIQTTDSSGVYRDNLFL